MTARGHHFVPRCYLKNFTTNKKITVVDLETADNFATNPKNIAQERDFNRIESDELPADALEAAYGKFESELAPILQSAAGDTTDLSKGDFDTILNLVALLAVRNPRHRSRFSDFQDDVRQAILEVASGTKERWEQILRQAKAAGYMEGAPDVPYDAARRSILEREFKFVTSTTEHAQIELHVFDSLLQTLGERNWRWLRAGHRTGGFITSDHPVALFWDVRPKGHLPLGFGLKGTTVLFPISPSVALEGSFDRRDGPITLDAFSVGDFNARILANAHRQIYAPHDDFLFFDGKQFLMMQDLIARLKQDKVKPTRHSGTRSPG